MTGGGEIAGTILPPEVWHRIAHMLSVSSAADLLSFQQVSRAAAEGVSRVEFDRHTRLRSGFGARSFSIEQDLIERTVLVHVVPPQGDGLFAIAECHPEEENDLIPETVAAEIRGDHVQGFDAVWIKNGRTIRRPLRIPGLPPPASVSNVQFSPDGRHVAMLVALDSGRAWLDEYDPIGRLTGLERHLGVNETPGSDRPTSDEEDERDEIAFIPSDECALVVLEMKQDERGNPVDMETEVFAHAFVPEYGFDMRWMKNKNLDKESEAAELAFAGILHARKTVALYMARWTQHASNTEARFQFIACLPDIAHELIEDKRDAMRVCDSTRVTSRVEMSEDLKTIFFDTSAKFGVVRVNQVTNAADPCHIEKSTGLFHSSPGAVPFDSTPRVASSRANMRARLSIRASFPAWASRAPRSQSSSIGSDGRSDTGRTWDFKPPRAQKIQRFLKDHLPWRRWFSVSAVDNRQSNNAAHSVDTPSSMSARRDIDSDVGTGIASALRRFLRSPGEPRPLRIADSSGPPSIPWHRHDDESPEGSDYAPMDLSSGVDETVSHTDGKRDSPEPAKERPRSGAIPRELHFGSDTGGRSNSSAKDSCDLQEIQSPKTEDLRRLAASPPVTSPHHPTSPRSETPSIRVTIQSPPRISRPTLPSVASRSRRVAFNKSSFASQSPRVTCMSPDGKKICSVYVAKLAAGGGEPPSHMTCVEVRSTVDGSVLFRNCRTSRTDFPSTEHGHRVRFEKTFQVVSHTCGFSKDSSLLWVRDAYVSSHLCVITRRLPTIFRVQDGAVIRTFSDDLSVYKHIQMAPDGLSIYVTRFEKDPALWKGLVLVDVIDVISGTVVATETVAGPMACPEVFNPQAVYLTGVNDVQGISRGDVDTLWECTRGCVGLHWSFHPDNNVEMM